MKLPKPLRRAGLAFLGFLPLWGALASMLWMLWANGSLRTQGFAAVTTMLGRMVTHPIGAVVLVQSLYTALLSVLWQGYAPVRRPKTAPDGGPVVWPIATVVIPAFNEGPMVERSIRSVARCDYPKDRLEIIVVDDGSRDDTFFHMQRLRREFPDLVKLIRFIGNRGKRAALEAGFRAAAGEIVVTIDSDSEIEPQTIHEMVTPFLADASGKNRVGAVAGRVAVLNRDSTISCMLEVQYALAFDFGRAAQSTYRAVACCPGALSAFRRDVIVPYLTEWTHQRFLGRPVGHGEDQALTNIVLRQGFDTLYQRTAVVHTLAPTTYRQMTRMFVRWDRSYIVEGLSFAKFMFTRYREKNRLLPVVTFVASNLRLVLVFWGLATLPSALDTDAGGLFNSAIALGVGALFSAAYYLRIERSFRFAYGLLYAVYSVFALQWILPWALLTVRDERWGTR